jgi:hypothetical protein
MAPEHARDLCTRAYKFDGRKRKPAGFKCFRQLTVKGRDGIRHPCIDARHAALANQNEFVRKHGAIAPIDASGDVEIYLPCNQGDREGCLVRDQEAAGSNPLAPTNPIKGLQITQRLEGCFCDVGCDVTLQIPPRRGCEQCLWRDTYAGVQKSTVQFGKCLSVIA